LLSGGKEVRRTVAGAVLVRSAVAPSLMLIVGRDRIEPDEDF
jgi:hypothetical protein